MQRNFVLTDVMKTGHHTDLESYIRMHSLPNQTFDMTGEYYTLHGFDLDSYDRKFAIIDRSGYFYFNNVPGSVSGIGAFHPSRSQEYREELERRKKLLHSQGFVFILATPWESYQNISQMPLYPEQTQEYIWAGGTSWFWFYMYEKYKNNSLTFDHSNKKFDLLYLNKMQREHRKKLFKKMSETNLLTNSLYTNWPDVKLNKEYELPWVDDYPAYGRDQDLYEKPYNHSKYSLVSESNDNNNDVFITEKLWKAIIAQHIFIVHGNHLYLQKLRELGFKTFSKYIDETYDLESDPDIRINKIVRATKELCSKNWQDLYLQTQDLRKHNYNTFFNREKLSEQINKQLNLFLEFADSR
tara:strand:- start:1633 stop:2697 length:1065 start_codon:yes stop_codon:yes gene_type:complete